MHLSTVPFDIFSKNYDELPDDEKKIIDSYVIVATMTYDGKDSKTNLVNISVSDFMKSTLKPSCNFAIIYNTGAEKVDDATVLKYCRNIRMEFTRYPNEKCLRINTWATIALIVLVLIDTGFTVFQLFGMKPGIRM
jgi:hypothetical protein